MNIQEHLNTAKRTGELEFTIEERRDDCVVSRMPVAAGGLNPFGTVQAGAMLWLADVTATVLAIANAQLGEKGQGFPLAINLNANLLGNQRLQRVGESLIAHHDGAQDRLCSQHEPQAVDLEVLLGRDGIWQLPPGFTVTPGNPEQVRIFSLANFSYDGCGQSSQPGYIKCHRFQIGFFNSRHIHPSGSSLLPGRSPK